MSIMKTEKFNNVTLEISNEGKLAIKEKKRRIRQRFSEIFVEISGIIGSFLVSFVLCYLFSLPVNDKLHKALSTGGESYTDLLFMYAIVFSLIGSLLSIAFFNREFWLFKICEQKSKKRLDFLPLSDKACQELNINSIEEYCEFLNHFLFRTPTGKTYKSNMSFDDAVQKYYYWKIAKMPKELLLAINEKFEESHKCIIYETSVRPDPFYMVYERSGRSSLKSDISILMNC